MTEKIKTVRPSGTKKSPPKNSKASFSDSFSQINLPLHGVRLPSFQIDKKEKRKLKVSEDITNYDFLRSLCWQGFKDLKVKKGTEAYSKYVERAKYELSTLEDLGFVDYVLLVWDVINYCKRNDIPTGLGRGSAAGSLVLYFIGVTAIDPIKHGLFFERFISKTRAKKKVVDGVTYLDGSLMCDVDLDICYYNRHKVLDYLENKFKGKTCKILTLNTLSGKLLIKECGKIIGEKSEGEMNQVTALIPRVFGQVKDLEETYEEVEAFKSWADENRKTYDIALNLRNLIKNKGVHPSGVLLSHSELESSCPIELSSDKNPVSSYDMNWASILNVKLDILGLRGVSVAEDVCKQVGIDMKQINLNESIIYQNLYELSAPHGLFQIEADTNYKVCQKVKPKNLEELSAVLALARPGALTFVDQYASWSNDYVRSSIHPFFDDILEETGGVVLYQEQLMKMANKVGFTLDEAEILRRIVGKKKVSEVRKWKKKIRDKAKENSLEPEVGNVLWGVLEDSANYSFNKSHSIAYAALAAITTYLKFKYPKEFFLSLLKMTRHEPDPINEISRIHKELSLFDIKLLPPHMTKSSMDFSIEGNNIRFGLLSIKGISDKSIEKLNNFRNIHANKFEAFASAEEAGLSIGILSALVQAGALEGFKQSRSKVVYEAQLWNILTDREKKWVVPMGEKHDYDLVKIILKLSSMKNEKGKLIIKESRMQTIRRKCENYKKIYELNSRSEDFANWYYENMLLGYTYGKTLKNIFENKIDDLVSVRTVNGLSEDTRVRYIGTVMDTYTGTSKNGNDYYKLEISDETGIVKTMIFNKKMEQCASYNGGLPQKGSIVTVSGTTKEAVVFADIIGIQDNKVYTKLSEIKKL